MFGHDVTLHDTGCAGCYDYELFDEIDFFPKDYKDYGCQPEGLIKEHNCSAVVCSNGVIHRKPIAGRCCKVAGSDSSSQSPLLVGATRWLAQTAAVSAHCW